MRFLEVQQAYRTLKDRYARARWEREEQDWERRQHHNTRVDGFGSLRSVAREVLEVQGTAGSASSGIAATFLPLLAEAFVKDRDRLWMALGVCVLTVLLIPLGGFFPGSLEPAPSLHEVSDAPRQAEERSNPGRARTAVVREKLAAKAPVAPKAEKAEPLRSTRRKLSFVDDGFPTREAFRGPLGPFGEDASGSPTGEATYIEALAVIAHSDGPSAAIPPDDRSPARAEAFASSIPPNVVATPATIGAWQGHWVASCIADRGSDLYRGSLEIADEARFRWASLATGAAGSVDHLALDFSGTAGETVPLRLLRANGDSRGGDRTVAMLERRASSGRTMTWQVHSRGTANQELAAPCTDWQIFADDGSPGFGGLWVLPSGEKALEGSLAPEYVELRIARKLSGYEGQFAGRYRVPVASMASEMRFQFHASSTAKGWHSWENADGVAGEVLLAALGRSRLAVVWRRKSISSGHPQLSGGVAVLRRME